MKKQRITGEYEDKKYLLHKQVEYIVQQSAIIKKQIDHLDEKLKILYSLRDKNIMLELRYYGQKVDFAIDESEDDPNMAIFKGIIHDEVSDYLILMLENRIDELISRYNGLLNAKEEEYEAEK